MVKPVQVGLIGYGYAGRTFHAPLLQATPGLELHSIVERGGSCRAAERYPLVNIVGDVLTLAEDPEIELVVVATPSGTHYEVARAMLEAGKHVVIDKPFTATVIEADELIRIASERGLVLSVFHNRRWDGDFLTLRELVDDRQLLGRLLEYEATWGYYSPEVSKTRWSDSDGPAAGILYDLGIHLIDQACQLFGRPRSVQGDIRILRADGRFHRKRLCAKACGHRLSRAGAVNLRSSNKGPAHDHAGGSWF